MAKTAKKTQPKATAKPRGIYDRKAREALRQVGAFIASLPSLPSEAEARRGELLKTIDNL